MYVHADSDPDSVAHANTDGNSYPYSNANSNPHDHTQPEPNSNADCYSNSDTNSYTDAGLYTKTYSDTQAAPIPHPAPDSVAVRRKPLRRSKVDGRDSASRCPCLCTDSSPFTSRLRSVSRKAFEIAGGTEQRH